jgi:hypothetical protein
VKSASKSSVKTAAKSLSGAAASKRSARMRNAVASAANPHDQN